DAILTDCARWPRLRQAREVLQLATPLSESALESLTKLLIYDAGLTPPELQVRIVDPDDGWYCRVDMLWREQRLILEADGLLKYDETGALRAEKRRQVRLERLGYRVERVIWADVMHRPAATAGWLRAL